MRIFLQGVQNKTSTHKKKLCASFFTLGIVFILPTCRTLTKYAMHPPQNHNLPRLTISEIEKIVFNILFCLARNHIFYHLMTSSDLK